MYCRGVIIFRHIVVRMAEKNDGLLHRILNKPESYGKIKYGNDFNNIKHDNNTFRHVVFDCITSTTSNRMVKWNILQILCTWCNGYCSILNLYWILEFIGQFPFKEMLLHGIICDSRGKKISRAVVMLHYL